MKALINAMLHVANSALMQRLIHIMTAVIPFTLMVAVTLLAMTFEQPGVILAFSLN